MVVIRQATEEDLPAVLSISNDAALSTAANFAIAAETLDMWQRDFREVHAMLPWFVADLDAEIVGFAKASPWKGRCAYAYSAEISVYVKPSHHRRGLGRRLYTRLLETLQRQGYRSVLGGIALPNPASVALHESLGMQCVGVLRRVGWKFGQWHDVGYWQGNLQDNDGPPGEILSVHAVLSSEHEVCGP